MQYALPSSDLICKAIMLDHAIGNVLGEVVALADWPTSCLLSIESSDYERINIGMNHMGCGAIEALFDPLVPLAVLHLIGLGRGASAP